MGALGYRKLYQIELIKSNIDYLIERMLESEDKEESMLFVREISKKKNEIKDLERDDVLSFDDLIDHVSVWAYHKDLLRFENAHKQMCKVIEEVGETSSALLRNNTDDIKDGIGDSFVTLIILAKQVGLEPTECLESAWNEIKNRTGKTVNGTFIKDENFTGR